MNKHFEFQVQQFLIYCKNERTLSEKTLKFYLIDLTQFKAFLTLNQYNSSVEQITKEIIRHYLDSIQSFKPKTIKRKLVTIKSLLNYCELEDVIPLNPFRKLKIKIKEPLIQPKSISINEIEKIINSAYRGLLESNNNIVSSTLDILRDILVVELLFATGVRVSELSSLKIQNINLNLMYIKVFGKGQKERIISLCDKKIIPLLQEYIALLESIFGNNQTFLFLNKNGKQLSDQSIRSIVKKHSFNKETQLYITPHVFRHSLATLLVESGVDISFIQKLLGHSSIITTQIYTHVSQNKQNEVIQLMHPRKLLKI